jgi:pimeloyl-ACP methyl ester carboxylesterase
MWRRVVPLLAPHHDAIAVTALGHRGGRAAPVARPVTIAHMVDDAERSLDELRIERAHFAGNSLGGWMALELARRGRALSVCALSPAGFWKHEGGQGGGGGGAQRAVAILRGIVRDARMGRAVLPLLARSARFRRWAMRANAVYGDRLTPEDLVGGADDLLSCRVAEDLMQTPEVVAPMNPLPCPIVIAWSEHDRILPLRSHGARAREILPGATFRVLDDVGHVPMFDDPARVARTILEVTALAR